MSVTTLSLTQSLMRCRCGASLSSRYGARLPQATASRYTDRRTPHTASYLCVASRRLHTRALRDAQIPSRDTILVQHRAISHGSEMPSSELRDTIKSPAQPLSTSNPPPAASVSSSAASQRGMSTSAPPPSAAEGAAATESPTSSSIRRVAVTKSKRKTPTLASRCYKKHTRHTLPAEDESGMVICFAQGNTEYCWRALPRSETDPVVIKVPAVLRAETVYNRVRLFGMPKGFPDTTAVGFQRFFYVSLSSSFVSNFASAIGYQSLLSGFFAGSSPQLWMLKDLIPALLAAYLANRVVSYENRPKFWFVVSVFMNNVTVIADMIIPSAVPQHMLAAAIVTSTVKQSSALMYFVTRAAALQHFAIYNNLAELTKKFNSFGMVTYTVATALGIVFCSYVPDFYIQLCTVVVCCAANMILSSMSMSPIAFRLLNFTTMELLMKRYFRSGGTDVGTPQEISDVLGVRMRRPPTALDDPADKTNLLYISPPIDKLLIRSDTIERDVLFVSENEAFLIGMWEPTPVPLTVRECWQRYELPAAVKTLSRWLSPWSWSAHSTQRDAAFGNQRLVLLVQQHCTPADFVLAYHVLYSAVLTAGSDEATLREHVRRCHREQDRVRAEATELRERLRAVGWDVDLPALDHPDLRLSDLFIPPSMRPDPTPPSDTSINTSK